MTPEQGLSLKLSPAPSQIRPGPLNSLKHGPHRSQVGVVETVSEALTYLLHILLQFPILQMAPIREVKGEITAQELRQLKVLAIWGHLAIQFPRYSGGHENSRPIHDQPVGFKLLCAHVAPVAMTTKNASTLEIRNPTANFTESCTQRSTHVIISQDTNPTSLSWPKHTL